MLFHRFTSSCTIRARLTPVRRAEETLDPLGGRGIMRTGAPFGAVKDRRVEIVAAIAELARHMNAAVLRHVARSSGAMAASMSCTRSVEH